MSPISPPRDFAPAPLHLYHASVAFNGSYCPLFLPSCLLPIRNRGIEDVSLHCCLSTTTPPYIHSTPILHSLPSSLLSPLYIVHRCHATLALPLPSFPPSFILRQRDLHHHAPCSIHFSDTTHIFVDYFDDSPLGRSEYPHWLNNKNLSNWLPFPITILPIDHFPFFKQTLSITSMPCDATLCHAPLSVCRNAEPALKKECVILCAWEMPFGPRPRFFRPLLPFASRWLNPLPANKKLKWKKTRSEYVWIRFTEWPCFPSSLTLFVDCRFRAPPFAHGLRNKSCDHRCSRPFPSFSTIDV